VCKTYRGINSGDWIANIVSFVGGEMRKNIEEGGSVDVSIVICHQIPFFVWKVCECVFKGRDMLL